MVGVGVPVGAAESVSGEPKAVFCMVARSAVGVTVPMVGAVLMVTACVFVSLQHSPSVERARACHVALSVMIGEVVPALVR